jgi:hypothetical protein
MSMSTKPCAPVEAGAEVSSVESPVGTVGKDISLGRISNPAPVSRESSCAATCMVSLVISERIARMARDGAFAFHGCRGCARQSRITRESPSLISRFRPGTLKVFSPERRISVDATTYQPSASP